MNRYKLKPCPFCGKPPHLTYNEKVGLIQCEGCNLTMKAISRKRDRPTGLSKKHDLLERWNRRAGQWVVNPVGK